MQSILGLFSDLMPVRPAWSAVILWTRQPPQLQSSTWRLQIAGHCSCKKETQVWPPSCPSSCWGGWTPRGQTREFQVKRSRYQLWTHRQLKPPSVHLTWRLWAAFVLSYFVLCLFVASRHNCISRLECREDYLDSEPSFASLSICVGLLRLQIHPGWAKKYKEYK